MKLLTISLCSLAVVALYCTTGTDIAVTQTGNPTQVSLMIKADTVTSLSLPVAKRTAAALTIEKAFMVIHHVEIEPVEGNEFILFQEKAPYIVELAPQTGSITLDSTQVAGSNRYESFEIEFGPLSGNTTAPLPDTLLKTNSIFVHGYVGNNPQDTFTYTSAVTGSFEFTFDSAVVLPDSGGTSILVKIKLYDWFTDSIGNLLDPRDPLNFDAIEDNLLNSVSGSEQEGEYDNSDEQ